MKAQGITRTAMAAEMETSRAQLNRMLDPEASNVTLDTLSRAERAEAGVEGGVRLGRQAPLTSATAGRIAAHDVYRSSHSGGRQ